MTTSVLANIPAVTSAAAVAEARGVDSAKLKTGKPITGKYLFDNFVVSKSDVTKMNIVEAASQTVGLTSFNDALREMVEMAKDRGESVLKTARNHASVLRNVYGALTFQRAKLEAAGWVAGKTGYHQANHIAKAVLKDAGIKWDGTRALTAEERKANQLARAESMAFNEAAKEIPRGERESLADWTMRVAAHAEGKVESALAEAQEKRVQKIVEAVKKMAGDDLAAVVDALMAEIQ